VSFVKCAYALAAVPAPVSNDTVGVDVYPLPGFVTVISVMIPNSDLDVAVAPVPPPPVIVTAGGTSSL